MLPSSPKHAERNSTATLAQKAIADRMGRRWQETKLTERELGLCEVFDQQLSLVHHDRDRLHRRIDALERGDRNDVA